MNDKPNPALLNEQPSVALTQDAELSSIRHPWVMKVHSNFYYVRRPNEGTLYECMVKGNLKKSGKRS